MKPSSDFGKRQQHYWLLLLGIPLLLVLVSCGAAREPTEEPTVSGRVVGEQGEAVPGATVRVQATENSTTANLEGEFVLTGVEA